jgi:hypothetical protein
MLLDLCSLFQSEHLKKIELDIMKYIEIHILLYIVADFDMRRETHTRSLGTILNILLIGPFMSPPIILLGGDPKSSAILFGDECLFKLLFVNTGFMPVSSKKLFVFCILNSQVH